MKIRLIGVSGFLNSGKDTLAEYLVDRYGFVRVALADPIKRFAYRVFLFSETQLWGPSNHRNNVDKRYSDSDGQAWEDALARLESMGRDYCADVLNTADSVIVDDAYNKLVHWFFWLRDTHAAELSPRIVLQTLGTEWGRDLQSSVWIDYLLRITKKLVHIDGSVKELDYNPVIGTFCPSEGKHAHVRGVVVSDVRFENEFQALRDAGGAIIRVSRPDADANAATVGIYGHASESLDLSFEHFDFVVNNDKSLTDLYNSVDIYMQVFDLAHH